MPYKDKEKEREYRNSKRKAQRLERGLQKQGRKPYTEEQKEEASKRNRKNHSMWVKKRTETHIENYLVYSSRHRAKNKNIEHTIKADDVIIPTHCPYLGIELQLTKRDKGTSRDAWPTIDRIDNTKGYTPDNIEIISFKANTMKNNATNEELLNFARKVLEKFKTSP